jgi:exonuclease SbcC
MRPNRLELTAFGAFPGRVEVDFDEIGSDGLVLLCGETGGGKTTLLDAVGFALYGTVPGERARARDLRSHHATLETPTEVRLEFTVGEARLRVTRSPVTERPRRGGGTARVPASALLERRTAGGWDMVARRNDDVGLEISLLLGMTAEQFFQVIMLPQGRFADFLQADHDMRERLLKSLFGVRRFERAETWLAERSRAAGAELASARAGLARIVATVAEAAATSEPADDGQAAPPADWAEALASAAAVAAADAAALARDLAGAAEAADAELAAAREIARRVGERDEATRTLAGLDGAGPGIDALAAEIDAARRAAPVTLAGRVASDRSRALGVARRAEDDARRALAALTTPNRDGDGEAASASADDLGRRADAARVEMGRLTDLADAVAAAEQEAVAAERAEAQADHHRARAAVLDERLENGLPRDLAVAVARQEAARAAAAGLPPVREQARLAGELARAVRERARAAASAAMADAAARAARELAKGLRDQRFEAMTAELAAGLEDGTPCPVCGSLTHPDPTEARADHVSKDREVEAEREATRLESLAAGPRREADRADERVLTLRGELDAQLAAARDGADGRPALGNADAHPALGERWRTIRLGLAGVVSGAAGTGTAGTGPDADPDRVAGALARSAAALGALADDLTAEAAAATGLEAELAALRAEESRSRAEAASHGAREAEARANAVQARERAARHRARLPAELSTAEAVARHRRELAAVAAAASGAQAAVVASVHAEREAARAAAEAAEAARSAGFPDAAAAAAAARDARWTGEAAERVDAHRAARTATLARLASDELAVSAGTVVDVNGPAAVARVARATHTAAVADAGRAAERAERLAALRADYATALEVLAPRQQRALELRELAELAAGRGANRLGMPLSSYVLAARLDEVAVAASQRLSIMSGGRFTLTRDRERRDRRRRTGLGLLVEDAWTGRARETATLSGGETFQAALALALGLADVVSAESGGASLDTLFIDEGFGSLDPDSLEEVMNVLDDLRSGGRLVGVVSHVSELRQRIPVQIEVVKGVRGSRVRTRV